MRTLNREQTMAVAALCVLLIACVSSVVLTLEIRADAVEALSDRQGVLSRLEARARSRTEPHGETRAAAAPVAAFLDAPTPGLAGAELQAYIARLADRHAALVSFGTQPSAGQDAADVVRIEASLDISLSALQVLLYQLESGTPYVFVESMTMRATTSAGAGGGENSPLRVTLGLRALWRRSAA
jgi:general secretion pathway protein M